MPPDAPLSGHKRQDTRRRLIRAAKHLFALHGADAVTARDFVIDEVGLPDPQAGR